MGPNAGDILQGFVAAMKCGLTKRQLDATVGLHPGSAQVSTTISQLIHKNSCYSIAVKAQNVHLLFLIPIDFFPRSNAINSPSPSWCPVTLCFEILCWELSLETLPCSVLEKALPSWGQCQSSEFKWVSFSERSPIWIIHRQYLINPVAHSSSLWPLTPAVHEQVNTWHFRNLINQAFNEVLNRGHWSWPCHLKRSLWMLCNWYPSGPPLDWLIR